VGVPKIALLKERETLFDALRTSFAARRLVPGPELVEVPAARPPVTNSRSAGERRAAGDLEGARESAIAPTAGHLPRLLGHALRHFVQLPLYLCVNVHVARAQSAARQ
jgi:hypothetical protein